MVESKIFWTKLQKIIFLKENTKEHALTLMKTKLKIKDFQNRGKIQLNEENLQSSTMENKKKTKDKEIGLQG